MKLLKPFNLIMFVLIPIIMFFGFNLRSYAADSGTVTISQTTGTSKAQFSGINGYYSLYGGTAMADDKYTKFSNITLNVKSSTSATFTRPLSVELHIVTTEGDFVLTGNKVHTLSTTNTSIKGTGYSSSFAGVPVGYYCFVDYQSSTNVTITISGSFDWETDYDDQNYWHTTINGHVVDTMENTNRILELLEDSSTPELSNLPNGYTPVLFAYNHTLTNGNEYIANDPVFNIEYPDTTFTSSTKVLDQIYTVPFGTRSYLFTLSFDTPSTIPVNDLWNITCTYNSKINGTFTDTSTGNLNYKQIRNYNSTSTGRSIFFIQVDNITDLGNFRFIVRQTSGSTLCQNIRYSAFVLDQTSSDWSVLANSDTLTGLNDTSDSIGTIISDNNDFESSAFTDFSNNLEEFGFDDWSLVPIATDLTTTKNIITMFYNILPFKVQWLFTSVMALGLIVMLLTVGTRVVQRTGDFTRAKPVKMKDSYHKKG